MLYFAKNWKLKMFPVQIQWEFASAVPISSAARRWCKRSDGIAPDRENACSRHTLISVFTNVDQNVSFYFSFFYPAGEGTESGQLQDDGFGWGSHRRICQPWENIHDQCRPYHTQEFPRTTQPQKGNLIVFIDSPTPPNTSKSYMAPTGWITFFDTFIK